jgi:hypothetical protein
VPGVSDGLARALLALSLALALWAAVLAALDRLPPKLHLQLLFVLQALVLVQAVVVLVTAGEWGGSKAELFGYLAVSAVLVPGGLVLAVEERTRWGTLVLGAACLTLAVVVVRLQAVWAAGA